MTVSILMPIYNGIEFLPESIDSIRKQTLTDWKLLIGINGHPKNSEVYNLAKKHADTKVEIFDFEFSGKAKALNTLAQLSETESLALLDVDDLWHPQKLEKQFPYLEYYDIVGTFAKYFGDLTSHPNIPFGVVQPEVFRTVNPIINSSALFKKGLAGWDETLHALEDYDMWSRLNYEGKKFLNIPECLTFHRIHRSSFFNTQPKDLQKEIQTNIIEKWKTKG